MYKKEELFKIVYFLLGIAGGIFLIFLFGKTINSPNSFLYKFLGYFTAYLSFGLGTLIFIFIETVILFSFVRFILSKITNYQLPLNLSFSLFVGGAIFTAISFLVYLVKGWG